MSVQDTTAVIVDASADVDITVDVTTVFGCGLSADAAITVRPIFLEVSDDTLACDANPVTLSANGFGYAQSFEWSSDAAFTEILNPDGDSIIVVDPSALATYHIRVSNGGCSLTDQVMVSLLQAGTTISPSQYICEGDTATLTVSNDFPASQLSHQWLPKEPIIAGQGSAFIRAIINEPTVFTVVSTTPQGCEVENSTAVLTSPLGAITIDATANPRLITTGESSLLTATPRIDSYTYQWTPSLYLDGDFGASVTSTPPESITYLVTITDFTDNGACQKSDTVRISVFDAICGAPNIYVPNAFTPNGDGENDLSLVRGNNISQLEFSIYNRWGEEVFKTEDQSRGWDGSYKGNLAEPAVYVYYLDARCGDGQEYFQKGNITLIR